MVKIFVPFDSPLDLFSILPWTPSRIYRNEARPRGGEAFLYWIEYIYHSFLDLILFTLFLVVTRFSPSLIR